MKVIAFYLPQFHVIKENNEWWGDGFTDWVNVKRAIKYNEKQYQPRVPLNKNYYDLSNIDVMKWQAEMAKKYGIYGFCMYHYWFNGHKLLEKPVENYLKHTEIDLPFCLCWANENWTNQWGPGANQKMLIEQVYGDEKDWKEHFDYMLPFFRDKRYIKENGKPLLVIYRPDLIDRLDEMLEKMDSWAKDNGLNGLCYAYQNAISTLFNYKNGRDRKFDIQIEYQPGAAFEWQWNKISMWAIKIKREFINTLGKLLHTKKLPTTLHAKKLEKRNYDKTWKCILEHIPVSEKCVPGAFVDWDNTPRKQKRGSFYEGASPEKFAYYFDKLIKRTKEVYHKDMIFIFAWNEWAEGGYLEPDEKNEYSYLAAVYQGLKKNNELPR
ncbi:MAG: glycosyl transferase [Lachnospiraceae bacterium]|nr:glycosyl transferase [Lachnospiraceae bacterium]